MTGMHMFNENIAKDISNSKHQNLLSKKKKTIKKYFTGKYMD